MPKYREPNNPSTRETDWAWLAGIIDGEGCIYIHKSPKKTCSGGMSYTAGIRIATIDPIIAYECERITGVGNLNNFDRTHLNKSWKPLNIWTVGSKNAVWVLRKCRPYLKYKGPQADIIFELDSKISANVGRKHSPELWSEKVRLYENLKMMHH